MKRYSSNFLSIGLICLACLVHAQAQTSPPRVAVFSQAGFPYFMVSSLTSPRTVAEDLRAAGIPADLLDADALKDANKTNIQNYAAIILPYGNTYPEAAFGNLQTYHRAGGCLILSGVPFTHPVTRDKGKFPAEAWIDQGHNSDAALFGPEGIGVGGFRGMAEGSMTLAPDDLLKLKSLTNSWNSIQSIQAIDIATLPADDKILPILVQGNQPVAALIVHHEPAFKDAVDVWTHHGQAEGIEIEGYISEQLLARGTVAALAQKGLLTAPQQLASFAALDRSPRPRIYRNLTLPSPPRPYPTFQPKMAAPALHLYVADVQRLNKEQRILLLSLQGIVNRKQPRIYLILGKDDTFWLDQLVKQGRTGAPIRVSDPFSLLRTFHSSIHGAVVPDPKVYVSPDIAADVAAADDLVIATPELASHLNLPIKSDLRGKFKDDADALRYARLHLLPRLNPFLSICLDPVLLDRGAIEEIIAARGMAFWITGSKAQDKPGANIAAEIKEIQAMFAELPLGSVVRGYWWNGNEQGIDEVPGVSLGSRFGKVTVVSDYVANFSVFSGVQIARLKQKPRLPAPALDASKVYVAITVSDGDNLVTWRDYFRQQFSDPLHGSFPIAWGMGPTLIDCAPTIAQWYYDHATSNDEFLCDVSGVGYINPSDWATALKDREGAYRSFYGWTQKYMDRMDLKALRMNLPNSEDIARAGKELDKTAFLMPDYGYAGNISYNGLTYMLPTGQAVFRAITNTRATEMADQIRTRVGQTRPAFVNAFIVNWGMKLSELKQMLNSLGPEYIAVTPSQLNTLYIRAKSSGLAK